MLFGGPWARPFPPYFVQYLHPVGFLFFYLFLHRPLLVWMWALRDVVLFLREGGYGDCDVDKEEERRLCCLSSSFCLRCPLCGAGPSMSVVVAAFALYLLLSDW